MVGPGTPHHLFAEMLRGMTGIEITYVPYRGSQPAITDVMAGHVPMMFCDLGPAGPQIAAGKVRAIGSSTMTRLAAFPDVPSLNEAGARGFDAASWQMMVAPAKTPRPVVDKLHAELKAILALPDVKEAIAKNGMVPMPDRSVEGLQDFVKIGDRALGQGGARRRDRRIAIGRTSCVCFELLRRLLPSALSQTALAQDYPTRPITIVVPFVAGGSTEISARIVAQQLEARLGKPVIVENRPGAGTVIGSNHVAKAAPDGYTLLQATSTPMAINVSVYKALPYDPATDLIPLAMVAQSPFILIVNPALPVKSVKELIAYGKANPGKLSYGSGGPGAPHHLYAELFASMTGIKMSHVPYKGSLPALNDVVGGHIQLMFCDVPPSAGMIQSGKVRALGVSPKKRLAAFPDIPTDRRGRRARLRGGGVVHGGGARQDAGADRAESCTPS